MNTSHQNEQHYEYLPLMEVLAMYPFQEATKTVNVFGVIIEYRSSTLELTIKDETCNKFTLSLNTKEKIKVGATEEQRELSLVPGDLIRIHRLTLNNNDYTRRCPRAHNVVVSTFEFEKILLIFNTFLISLDF